MGAGNSLKKLREQKGLSVKDIHKITKIHERMIYTIEEDRLDEINPTYAVMFIKSYCKALNVDSKEYLNSFAISQGRPEKKKETVSSSTAQPQVRVRFGFKKRINRINFKLLASVMAAILVIILLFSVVKFLFTNVKRFIKKQQVTRAEVLKKKETEKELKKNAAQQAKKSFAAEDTKTDVKVTSTTPSVSPAINGENALVLSVKTKKKIWTKVRVDDETVFENYLARASLETWKAQDKIELWSSNVRELEIELNGRLLSPLGKVGTKIKHILITKKGLSIVE